MKCWCFVNVASVREGYRQHDKRETRGGRGEGEWLISNRNKILRKQACCQPELALPYCFGCGCGHAIYTSTVFVCCFLLMYPTNLHSHYASIHMQGVFSLSLKDGSYVCVFKHMHHLSWPQHLPRHVTGHLCCCLAYNSPYVTTQHTPVSLMSTSHQSCSICCTSVSGQRTTTSAARFNLWQ